MRISDQIKNYYFQSISPLKHKNTKPQVNFRGSYIKQLYEIFICWYRIDCGIGKK